MYDTVICIPYRNRKAHLDYFLANSVPLLEHCFPDAHVVVVEQSDDGRLFNRGKLLNVAFHEYKDRATTSWLAGMNIQRKCASQMTHNTAHRRLLVAIADCDVPRIQYIVRYGSNETYLPWPSWP